MPYDDSERATAFYRDVFGWAITPMPEMDYTIVSTGPVTDEGMPAEPGYIGGGLFQRDGEIDRPTSRSTSRASTTRSPPSRNTAGRR